jgi:tuftelin-interacting protein 11
LEPLYGPIRLKLGHALAAWHPSDGSALALLSPWQRVFSPPDWEALLVRCIGPKLGFALQELAVNPAAQVLDPLQWVLAWAEAMSTRCGTVARCGRKVSASGK